MRRTTTSARSSRPRPARRESWPTWSARGVGAVGGGSWWGRCRRVCGPLDRGLVEPKSGDLLAVMTAGAYGAVQAGTYNTRALIPEALVRDTEWALVRPRLEADQLIALDRIPGWL